MPNTSVRAADLRETADCAAAAADYEADGLFSGLAGAKDIAVAVSGGSDSMALLLLLCDWKALSKANTAIHVLTVDHGLRSASRAEAEQVGRWCARLGVGQHILTWPGPKPAQGIQAAARRVRYDLMSQWCKVHGVPILLTAHTANDQAETVAMRRRRTDSLRSLAGIWPESIWSGVRVVRPVLNRTRSDLRAYLRRRGQGWLDDPSNENEVFERVRVRRQLMLSDIGALANQAALAHSAVTASDAAAMAWLRHHVGIKPYGYLQLPRAALAGLARSVMEAVLSWSVATAGSGRRPERSGIARLADFLLDGGSGRHTLAGAVVAVRRQQVLIGREAGRMGPKIAEIGPSGELLWDDRFLVRGRPGTRIRAAGVLKPGVAQGLPAFVTAALPVIEFGTETPIFPHFRPENGVSVNLSERFRI